MSSIKLCNSNNCTSCYACVSVCPQKCIQMKKNEEGIFYPEIDENRCIECGACVRSCHQLTDLSVTSAIRIVYAGWAKNPTIRQSSSSGGVFPVIAGYIIGNKGVVYGASFDENLQLKHIEVGSLKYIKLLQGSKYVQSDIAGIFTKIKQELSNGIYVLFTGTPCQVAGLKTYLKKDYDNLVCVDLICHGVPPQRVFNAYLSKIGVKSKCHNFQFRYLKGWGFELSYKGKVLSPKNSYYLKAFTKGFMFIDACYNCKYAKPQRTGDITLADFWNIGEKEPFLYSTDMGVSMILTNTEKGEKLLQTIANDLCLYKRTIEEAVATNHNLTNVSEYPTERTTYLKDSIYMPKRELIKKYGLNPEWKDYIRPLYRKIKLYFVKK